jgi:hypothetical protein
MKKQVTLLLLIFTLSVQAQDYSAKSRNWTLNGYVKYMQTISFQHIDEHWMTDNLLHNRLIFNWNITGNLTFNTQMRNRIFYGETVSNFPEYPDIINNDNGLMNLTLNIFEGKSVFMNTAFDRLYLDFNIEKFQITVGRQRINWGQSFVWNPNDLFNSYSFFDFDYEEKSGSDAVRVQFYPSYSSKLDMVLKVDKDNNITAAALYRFNKWSYDIQFLGGYYNGSDVVIGAGFSGSLFKGGLSGEISFFYPQENFADTSGNVVASLGYNYTFSNSLMLQFEALYNGYGTASGDFNIKEFYFMQLTPQTLSLTRFSFFGQVSYPFTPLFTGTLSVMYNPNDNSLYAGPSLSFSLVENLELSAYGQYFTSNTPADEGGKGVFLYWRIKWSF